MKMGIACCPGLRSLKQVHDLETPTRMTRYHALLFVTPLSLHSPEHLINAIIRWTSTLDPDFCNGIVVDAHRFSETAGL
jgi:hypothetical protein